MNVLRALRPWHVAVACLASSALAQDQPAPAAPPASVVVPALTGVAPAEMAFTLRFGNPPIFVLRGMALGRTPEERATAAAHRLDGLANLSLTGPVDTRLLGGVAIVTVAGREALTVLPTDADSLAGETLEIMSPHYEADPAAPNMVPKSDWHAAPARPDR
jgi:hypothetical protein